MARFQPCLVAFLIAAAWGGCGNGSAVDDRGGSTPASSRRDPGFDPDDPATRFSPATRAPEVLRASLFGHAPGFRVRRSALVGLKPGPMARTAVARIWNELVVPDRRYWRLTPGQRAVFALELADFEIREGGFDQLWLQQSGYVCADLAGAARHVGAPALEAIFRAAAALFPNGVIPRDHYERQVLASYIPDAPVRRLNERYAELRLHRRTSTGLILGEYVRTHMDEFVAE